MYHARTMRLSIKNEPREYIQLFICNSKSTTGNTKNVDTLSPTRKMMKPRNKNHQLRIKIHSKRRKGNRGESQTKSKYEEDDMEEEIVNNPDEYPMNMDTNEK